MLSNYRWPGNIRQLKIVTETVERIARRPVPVRLINATTIAAMGLFLVLFAVLVVQDFNNFIL